MALPAGLPASGVALASAVSFGTGDLIGGIASRGRDQFQVLLLASLSGLVGLLVAAFAAGEGWPQPSSIAWASAAGVTGALGIVALYRGLAIEQAAAVAPVSAVVGTTVPVIVGALVEGPPPPLKWAGMALGAAGIWLASGGPGAARRANGRGVRFGVAAGIGFGAFFSLIAQVRDGGAFAPLTVAKGVAVLFACAVLAARRTALPSLRANLAALAAGVLDASGNALYLLATRLGRIDAAAILSSMGSAVTVLLAALLLKQRTSGAQKLGVLLCLGGIALIAG